MNCLLIKNIVTNEYTTYYGKKNAFFYANSLIDSPSEYQILGNDLFCDIYKKTVSKGYLYNTEVKNHLYNIQKIDIVFDKVENETKTKKQITSKYTPLQQELMDELKQKLSRRRQLITGEIELSVSV
jgi:hypothetical protein